MHQDHPAFPAAAVDMAALGLSPIGVVRDGDGPWLPLAVDGRRAPHVIVGSEAVPLDKAEAGPALYAALDETCERLWGHSWNSAVGEIFRMNRRTTQRDRVSTNLLPPRVLQIIAYVASVDDAPEMAAALLALARYSARFGGDERVVRRYWANVADVFFGDADKDIGAE